MKVVVRFHSNLVEVPDEDKHCSDGIASAVFKDIQKCDLVVCEVISLKPCEDLGMSLAIDQSLIKLSKLQQAQWAKEKAMTDYITTFCQVVPVDSEEEKTFIESLIEKWNEWYDGEEEPPEGVDIECGPCVSERSKSLFLLRDNSGASSIECAAYVVAEWQKKFEKKDSWSFVASSETCRKFLGYSYVSVKEGVISYKDEQVEQDE